jgi:arylsulfatase A-like enzyme
MLRRALGASVAVAVAALLAVTCRGSAPRPNLLLVTIETFRQDHLGANVDGVALTPNLDALQKRGTAFERAYAAASFTLPSLHTIATGEPPGVHRVRFWTKFGNRFTGPTLAGLLAEEGYRTGFVYSAYIELNAYPILQRGWTGPRGAEAPTGFAQVDADAVLQAASSWLDMNASEPFFLWVHLFEPHTPYGPGDAFVTGLADLGAYHAAGPATFKVQDWADKVPGGQGPALADRLYAADIRAADDAVARLLADLERRGLTSKTVVCVTSDHGENLRADPEPRWDHGISTDEQLIRVPMIWLGPGVPAARTDPGIARHLDVAPTLLQFAGADIPEGWRGRDLFGRAPAPKFAISEGTTSDHPDSPFYSVTNGETSLRLYSSQTPWRTEVRDERLRGTAATPIDLTSPSAEFAPWTDAWREEADALANRAVELNEAGDDHGVLTPQQVELLKIGYMGGTEHR